jgi:hypothetical protein
MKYRKLRIAFSAACGVLCVVLIVLWVRSYWHTEFVWRRISVKWSLAAGSFPGAFGIGLQDSNLGWGASRIPSELWMKFPSSPPYNSSRVWGAFFVDTRTLLVPYWFVISVTSSLGALPWIRWRFRLRTLLIATTLIAILLGLTVYTVR